MLRCAIPPPTSLPGLSSDERADLLATLLDSLGGPCEDVEAVASTSTTALFVTLRDS